MNKEVEAALAQSEAQPVYEPLSDGDIDKIAATKIPIAAYMGMFDNANFSRDDAERVIRQFARSIERIVVARMEAMKDAKP